MSRRGLGRNTTDDILDMIPSLRLLARGFLCDPDAADDLVQETLTRALAGISGFTPGTDLRAWLFIIMRNCLRSDLRRDRRAWRGGPEPPSAEAACPPAPDIGIGCTQMLASVRRLPRPYREALIVVFLM